MVAMIQQIDELSEQRDHFEREWENARNEIQKMRFKNEIDFEDILIEKDREIAELRKKIEYMMNSSTRNRSAEKFDELRELKERMVE